MNSLLVKLSLCVALAIGASAVAAKSEDKGNMKPRAAKHQMEGMEQKDQHRMTERSEEDAKKLNDREKERLNEMREEHAAEMDGKPEKDDAAGLEKQRAKKAEQEMKELDKGSEQGQQQREENRKKWWRFWE